MSNIYDIKFESVSLYNIDSFLPQDYANLTMWRLLLELFCLQYHKWLLIKHLFRCRFDYFPDQQHLKTIFCRLSENRGPRFALLTKISYAVHITILCQLKVLNNSFFARHRTILFVLFRNRIFDIISRLAILKKDWLWDETLAAKKRFQIDAVWSPLSSNQVQADEIRC